MAQIGINLGGWLVLEKWITPSLFAGTNAQDEASLSALGTAHRAAITRHHQTFVTKKDIAWLKKQGVTCLRVPVGYWLFGHNPPFQPGILCLDKLFEWAEKYDMSVFLSVHAAPGSQNGKDHSGRVGDVRWKHHQKSLLSFTEKLVDRYQSRKCLLGIGLLNEPAPDFGNFFTLFRYYITASHQIKRKVPHLQLYIDGTFHARSWTCIAAILKLGIDLHLYHGFGGADYTAAARKLYRQDAFIRQIKRFTPVIIGEWSAVISQPTSNKTLRQYVTEQQSVYKAADTHFYWTYKTEDGGWWSFKDTHET